MNTTAETNMMETNAVLNIEPAPTVVEVAEAELLDAKGSHDAAVTALRDARVYLKDIETALVSLPEDDAENRAAGAVALEQAKLGLDAAVKAEADAKAAMAAAKKAIPEARKQLREQAKAAKAEAKAAKDAAKVQRVTQNGMTQPAPGTISATLWGIFDAVSAAKGAPAAIGEVFEQAKAAGVVDASIRAGYAHWRKFHGVTGRVMSEEAVAAKKAKEEEAARKAAAAAEAAATKAAEAAAAVAAAAAENPVAEEAPAATTGKGRNKK